jgi:hypothetical protein
MMEIEPRKFERTINKTVFARGHFSEVKGDPGQATDSASTEAVFTETVKIKGVVDREIVIPTEID